MNEQKQTALIICGESANKGSLPQNYANSSSM